MYEVEDVPLFSQFIEFLSWLEVWLCPCSFCLYWDDQMVLAMKLLCCLDCFALPVAQQPLKSQPHPDLAWKGCQPSVLGWTSSHMPQRPAISSPHLFASSVNCYKFQKHSSFHTLGDFFFSLGPFRSFLFLVTSSHMCSFRGFWPTFWTDCFSASQTLYSYHLFH